MGGEGGGATTLGVLVVGAVLVVGVWVLMGGEWAGDASGLMEEVGMELPIMEGRCRPPWPVLVTGWKRGRPGGSM